MTETLAAGRAPATDDIHGRFTRDAGKHEMTVFRDDGLYRHLRFRQPLDPEKKTWTGAYWFEIVTWPGSLLINGDVGTYVFSREPDMLEFFRGHQPNPHYWAQKTRNAADVRAYSDAMFRQLVGERIAELTEYDPQRAKALRAESAEFSAGDYYNEGEARELLADWERRDLISGSWEWDLTDWTYRFLWCCHAVPWGIAKYDEARATA